MVFFVFSNLSEPAPSYMLYETGHSTLDEPYFFLRQLRIFSQMAVFLCQMFVYWYLTTPSVLWAEQQAVINEL